MSIDTKARSDFSPCSHPNPIDPAEYPGQSGTSAHGHSADFQVSCAQESAKPPSGKRDRTVRIAPVDWQSCFDRLSRSHRGWLATLAVSDAPWKRKVKARNVPFAGVVQEPLQRAIWVRLGPLGHFVDDPSAVWMWIGPDGAEKALGIESADGAYTVLSFRSALPTEMVDGLAPSEAPA